MNTTPPLPLVKYAAVFFICTFLWGATPPVAAGTPGTSSAQFLKIPAGARAFALGGAFSAASGDISALYWNPAGAATLPAAIRPAMLSAEMVVPRSLGPLS